MAANLQNRGLVSFGKRFLNQISYANARNSANSSTLSSSRRMVHVSVYDKNPEEYARSYVVPDEVMVQSDKYWTPHPQTGVFGPATDHIIRFSPVSTGVDSVLEQKAFFRPLEDLEKPTYA